MKHAWYKAFQLAIKTVNPWFLAMNTDIQEDVEYRDKVMKFGNIT